MRRSAAARRCRADRWFNRATHRRLATLIQIAVLPWVVGVAGAETEIPAILASAFANMRHEPGCDFTRTQQNSDEVQVERFDETDGQARWTLLSVDGEPPSKRRLRKYARQDERRASRQHPARVKFDDLAEPGSYRLIDENAQRAVYRFKPIAEDEDAQEFMSFLTGTLTVDKSTPHVAAFEMTTSEPFSPAATVTVQQMSHRVEFAPLSPDGIVVLRRIQMDMKGRVFGFKKIDQNQLITFDDFDCRQ